MGGLIYIAAVSRLLLRGLFLCWRRLYAEGAPSAVGAGEEIVPASEYRALQSQVRELQRVLGKKSLENEILREALDLGQKNGFARALARAGRYAVKTITDTLGVATRMHRPRAAESRGGARSTGHRPMFRVASHRESAPTCSGIPRLPPRRAARSSYTLKLPVADSC